MFLVDGTKNSKHTEHSNGEGSIPISILESTCLVRISARAPAVLTEVFRGFLSPYNKRLLYAYYLLEELIETKKKSQQRSPRQRFKPGSPENETGVGIL
jgi:hypothetical protein